MMAFRNHSGTIGSCEDKPTVTLGCNIQQNSWHVSPLFSLPAGLSIFPSFTSSPRGGSCLTYMTLWLAFLCCFNLKSHWCPATREPFVGEFCLKRKGLIERAVRTLILDTSKQGNLLWLWDLWHCLRVPRFLSPLISRELRSGIQFSRYSEYYKVVNKNYMVNVTVRGILRLL